MSEDAQDVVLIVEPPVLARAQRVDRLGGGVVGKGGAKPLVGIDHG